MKPFTTVFNKLTVLCAISFTLTACATPSQVYWDAKVKEMCEKDGGVTVYEKVELTKEERNHLRIAPVSVVTEKDSYFLKDHTDVINEKNPRVTRFEALLYRSFDKKLLTKQVDYSRVGGDIPNGISAPSSYSCDEAGISTEIVKSTFFIKGQ